ncbi:hypothetical protein F2P56_007864 [Juglans regia]|uniref:Uncharacterized protein n=1 Tax=Juglans regia TaxID=51240 RepID=A0A833Y2D9_JUGRE|nr:hypothetical protein F2P56_007864 [Juglans regia]
MLSANFEMKDLGEASFVLSIEICRDRARGLLGLSQKAYIRRVLQRFEMHNCAPGDVPIIKGDKFNKTQCPKNELERDSVKNIPYASAVGSLMYAQVCTRPDIAYAVSVLSRFQSNPGQEHWKAAKKHVFSCIFTDISSTWKAMEALYVSGKARAIGVSNFSSKKLGHLLEVARVPPVVNQVECHPSWQQAGLHAFCKSKGVHLSGYSPLGSPGSTWVNSDVLKNPILGMVAEKVGKTPAQVALR